VVTRSMYFRLPAHAVIKFRESDITSCVYVYVRWQRTANEWFLRVHAHRTVDTRHTSTSC